MKKILLICFSLIVITALSACQTNKYNNVIKDNAPDPSVSVEDLDKNIKEGPNTFYFDTEQGRSLFDVVFWDELKEDHHYQGQIKNNDVKIDEVFKGKKIEIGPLPKHYELAMTFSQKEPFPSIILGKVKDDKGHTYNWKQSYDRKDADHAYLINLPEFKGEKAQVALRMVWLNKNGECIGVADKFFILDKQ
ncbi:hypothetical protein MOF38_00375 [Bacillus haynesii]|uniref:hypothetical protein n=1 Tax=Bacillus haynesii TaxID=1925021 RepID=UPI00227F15AC|nr:hypothetical protein [Bacillus haynesii]MCY7769290.1 hypothetical protein [Bacillus haynesii]MCY8007509.1 hypothetical protein [Bacillus haynesii]MCY8011740.1 hypothetical protein [Bacillus haynesii]MCY8046114.1 hypothetical protein [Bacillus haynesii]MCY8077743.1 hypothetical protein [Bacillus haynesii]